jgi:hypothetical protein
MNIHCPRCGSELPTAQVNVATDVGACRACENLFPVSIQLENELARRAPQPEVPEGAWLVERADGFELGASLRSGQVWLMLPFMVLWSCGVLARSSRHPHNSGMFLLVGAWFWCFTLYSLLAKTRLRVRRDQAEVLTGIGPLSWSTTFRWSAVRSVHEVSAGKTRKALSLETDDDRHQVMHGLTDRRRRFLVAELRRRIVNAPVAPGGLYR